MITPQYVREMAEYNRWMNDNLYRSARSLTNKQIGEDRGAFFRSLHGTFAHLIWADQLWLARFTGDETAGPDATRMHFDELAETRAMLDDRIMGWANTVQQGWLEQPLSWFSGLYKKTFTQPGWLAVTHFFNHQTHHRGQATTLLMQFGIDPGVTDLMFMATQKTNLIDGEK